MTDRERLLDELRPVAFAIACRMLSSVSEAENVAQEALLRVHQALDAGEQIASPRAFAATVTTGWAINELRSAGALRERYVGEWLPEPIITDGHDDPAWHAEMADSLSLAMLVPAAPAPVPAGRAALMSWEQATPATPALPRPPPRHRVLPRLTQQKGKCHEAHHLRRVWRDRNMPSQAGARRGS